MNGFFVLLIIITVSIWNFAHAFPAYRLCQGRQFEVFLANLPSKESTEKCQKILKMIEDDWMLYPKVNSLISDRKNSPIKLLFDKKTFLRLKVKYGHNTQALFSPEALGTRTILLGKSLKWLIKKDNQKKVIQLLSHELAHLFHYQYSKIEKTGFREGLAGLIQILTLKKMYPDITLSIKPFNKSYYKLLVKPPIDLAQYQYLALLYLYLYQHFGRQSFLTRYLEGQLNGFTAVDGIMYGVGQAKGHINTFNDIFLLFNMGLIVNSDYYHPKKLFKIIGCEGQLNPPEFTSKVKMEPWSVQFFQVSSNDINEIKTTEDILKIIIIKSGLFWKPYWPGAGPVNDKFIHTQRTKRYILFLKQ